MLVVRLVDNVGLRGCQLPPCKARSRRRIGHTSSERNAVRVAAGSLPTGESVFVRAGVARSRRMPDRPSNGCLATNKDRLAEPHIIN